MCPFPGKVLGRAEDRPERHADPRLGPTGLLGGLVYRRDLLGGLGQRLAPQSEHVRMLAADPVGRLRGAAEVQGDVRLLDRTHSGQVVLQLVVPPLVAERFGGRPRLADDVEVLVGAVVAFVLGQVVAVAPLFGVAAAGDDVDGDPAGGEVVEGGEIAGRDRREDHPRPVRDQVPQALGVGRGIGRDLDVVG